MNDGTEHVMEHSRGRWGLLCEGCGETWYPSKLAGSSPYAGSGRCPWCGHDATDRVRSLTEADDE